MRTIGTWLHFVALRVVHRVLHSVDEAMQCFEFARVCYGIPVKIAQSVTASALYEKTCKGCATLCFHQH